MGNILLLFLVLFPMLLSAWVFPLRRRDRRYRNWLIQIIPAVELAAALLLLLWPGAALELPGVFGFGLRLQAGSLGSLLALVSAFLWAATGLNCPSYFAAAEGCNRFYFFWLLTLGALMGVFLAADLFTLFVFFEMMSFTSYVWVVQNETEEARQALDETLQEALRHPETPVQICYFRPDVWKSGGAYVEKIGHIRRIDVCGQMLEFADGEKIPLETIRSAGDWRAE